MRLLAVAFLLAGCTAAPGPSTWAAPMTTADATPDGGGAGGDGGDGADGDEEDDTGGGLIFTPMDAVGADADAGKSKEQEDLELFCNTFHVAKPPEPIASPGDPYTCPFESWANKCLTRIPDAYCINGLAECLSGTKVYATWSMCKGLYYCIGIPKSKLCSCGVKC